MAALNCNHHKVKSHPLFQGFRHLHPHSDAFENNYRTIQKALKGKLRHENRKWVPHEVADIRAYANICDFDSILRLTVNMGRAPFPILYSLLDAIWIDVVTKNDLSLLKRCKYFGTTTDVQRLALDNSIESYENSLRNQAA